MTITLHLNRTYRTRDGSAEHKIDRILRNVAWSGNRSWFADSGRYVRSDDTPNDLVEEVLFPGDSREYTTPTADQPATPVRQRTVTEIESGDYGRLRITAPEDINNGVGLEFLTRDLRSTSMFPAFTADELDQIAQTATQLAAALRQIKTEAQS